MLTAGSRVGSFIIHSPIGSGGMGEVYLAEDARLQRRVALKLIAPELATDAAAGKRLLREARAAATLDHPNICTVYEVGEADGRTFIAMQYVDGGTLADRLKQAPLPLATAIAIGAQVANALAEAHRHGIVHRDVKPQNVMLSAANHATVLDFGLAKAAVTAGAAAGTVTEITQAGVVSGTLSYMSPEQARGETVDERSDVFSFGILLYELVAGAHPFAQESWADTLAAILDREARAIPIAIPAELRRILRKSLAKDRDRRYQSMRDAAIDLENLAQELSLPAAEAVSAPTAAAPGRSRARQTTAIAVASAVLLLAALAAARFWRSGDTRDPMQAGYETVTDFTDSATAPSLSPDGRMITFIRGGSWFLTTTGQIYVKMLPNGEAIKLTDDPRAKMAPAFSADGTRIAYTALAPGPTGESWDTWTVPVSGGTPTRLLANASGLTWLDPRHVLFSEIQDGSALHMALVTATEDRRDARQIYLPSHERAMAHFSAASPDRAWVLVVEMGPSGAFERCKLLPFDASSTGHQVGPSGECNAAAWSPDQRWMYFAAEVEGFSHLWRQRFPDGVPELLTSNRVAEEQGVAVAPDGRSLVTSIGVRQSSLWLHSAGGERLLSPEGHASAPMLSRDGARMYYLLRRAAASGVVELRVMDVATQKSERLLPDFNVLDYAVSGDEQHAAVTTHGADGSREIWLAALDRRTAPRRVVQGGDNVAFGANRTLVFRSIEGQVNFITRIGFDGTGRMRLSDIPVIEVLGTSPDGQWANFVGRSDNDQIAVMAVPIQGGHANTLCYRGCLPQWSPDATSLYLAIGTDSPYPTLVVPVKPGHPFPEFPTGTPEAMTAWRTLAGVRTLERPTSIPGADDSTYVLIRTDERRNLFRVPLTR